MKVLFGQASSCAFPDCGAPLIFEDRARGVRTVSAEIAHIRSGSERGPRHVGGFGAVDEAENLLLLCPLHHKPVDEKASVYTIEELEIWKEEQIARGVGAQLEETEIEVLAEKLDALIDLLTLATTLDVSCRLVSGCENDFGGLFVMPFDSAGSIRIGNEPLTPTSIGVEVINSGALSCQIVKAGLELDAGVVEYASWSLEVNAMTRTPLPHDLGPHSSAQWLGPHAELGLGILEIAKVGALVERFRGFCITGSDRKAYTEWHHSLELPVFRDTLTHSAFDDLVAKTRQSRA